MVCKKVTATIPVEQIAASEQNLSGITFPSKSKSYVNSSYTG